MLISSRVVQPELRLAWQHEFLDASRSISAAFIAAPSVPFTVTGARFGRDSALLGFGASTVIDGATQLYFDYDSRLGGGLDEHTLSLGLRIKF